ncbi:MAG: hypothetical protein JWQ35_1867 [Bacteriovoracaceae bacterium]|nr:hypothetical protein [Bacteriovoracaceae bacterium]
MMKRILFILTLALIPIHGNFAVQSENTEPNSLVITKDMTIPSRSEYENIVVMSGNVDLFGKVEKLVVMGGLVRIHDGAEIKNQMMVLGGSVEQLEGAKIPEAPKTKTPSSFLGRWKTWTDSWISSWKHRFESPDDDENAENKSDKWPKIFLFPFLLAVPLSVLIILFGLGMLFLALAPKISATADEILERDPFVSLAWGAISYLFFTPLIAILTLSIIGIPLVPIVVLFALLFILAGFFCASRTLGHMILYRTGLNVRALDTLLGLLLLYGVLFMPIVGKLLVFFILMAGTGAVIRSVLHGRSFTHFHFGKNNTYDI